MATKRTKVTLEKFPSLPAESAPLKDWLSAERKRKAINKKNAKALSADTRKKNVIERVKKIKPITAKSIKRRKK